MHIVELQHHLLLFISFRVNCSYFVFEETKVGFIASCGILRLKALVRLSYNSSACTTQAIVLHALHFDGFLARCKYCY